MINVDVPINTEATPQLTINRDVAENLDSSNAFEGPEKLLEVWFAPSADALPPGAKPYGLKSVPRAIWEPMLDEVHCKILSVTTFDQVDAYLLSESSMFVFPHKVILKTCGTTTLLQGLRSLLRIAAVEAGFPFNNVKSMEDKGVAATPYRLFYSRKNFLFPDQQPAPHRSWGQEVKFLDDSFTGGRAYMVGRVNANHWFLYIISPETIITPPRTPEGGKRATTSNIKIPMGLVSAFRGAMENNDETLEILMTDLDPEKAKQFYLENASAVAINRVPTLAQEARQLADDSLGDLSASTLTFKTTSTADSVVDETFDSCSLGSDSDAQGTHTPLSELADPASLTTEGHALGTVVSETCGLSNVYPTSKYPGARIDAYMFNPCGFSANGLVPAPPESVGDAGSKAAHYFTVHVTPEPHCSYASFETNVPGGQNGRETSDIIKHVVGIFKPGHFSVTLFVAKDPICDGPTVIERRIRRPLKIDGYYCIDRINHDFEDYDLLFRSYEREDWVGESGMRVGEEDII